MDIRTFTNSPLYDLILSGSAVVSTYYSFSTNGRSNGFSSREIPSFTLYANSRIARQFWKKLGYGMQMASFFAAGLPLLIPLISSTMHHKTSEKEINDVRQCWRANAWMMFTTHFIKLGLKQKRPDSHSFDSFPSGHTMATTVNMLFAAHTLSLCLKERGVSPDWAEGICYGGASTCSLIVGASRVLCRRHTVLDVAAGLIAGGLIGILHIDFSS